MLNLIRTITVTLVGAFLVIETYYQIAFRWSDVLPSFWRIYDFRHFDSEGTPGFIPNTAAWHKSEQENKDTLININKHGFRGGELLDFPSSRIAMIGDSTVFNGGIEHEKTFPFLVEQSLRKTRGDSSIEVLNFGVGDTNIRQYYLKLKNHVLKINPDLIVIFIYLNDTIEPLVATSGQTNKTPNAIWYHSFAIEHLYRFWRNFTALREAQESSRFDWVDEFQNQEYLNHEIVWQRMLNEARYDWGAAWQEHSWNTIEHWVSEMLKLTSDADVPTWFVLFPVEPQVQIREPYKNLFVPQKFASSMADRKHIRLLDPLLYLRDYSNNGRLFYDQCHLTELGNRAVADFLVPPLQKWIEEFSSNRP